jgi:DNA damage-binding protein 1
MNLARSDETQSILNLVSSRSIYGRITILSKFRPPDSLVDYVFVGTERAYFFTVRWNSATAQLESIGPKYKDLGDRTAREIQTGERSQIDPSGQYMLLEVYEGFFTTLSLRHLNQSFQKHDVDPFSPIRIPEFHIKSTAFLREPEDPKEGPRVAILWEDYDGNAKLKYRKWDESGSQPEWTNIDYISNTRKDMRIEDPGASHLIQVQEEPYGLIILGESSVVYFDDSGRIEDVTEELDQATVWASWARIDNQRYVLADEFGKLYLMMLHLNGSNIVTAIRVEEQGSTSQAACLVHLDEDLIFVGSQHGDSQVVRLLSTGLEVVQTIANLAPILDFTVMDMGNRSGDGPGNEYSTGQARIVTGSGAWKDGSIRSVRSGVGVQDLAVLPDFEHVMNLFSLRVNKSSSKVNALLLSFADETRLLLFDSSGGVQEIEEYNGIVLNEQTLLATNVENGTAVRVLQVTRSSVHLLDLEGGKSGGIWSPPDGEHITSAAANQEALAICFGGRSIVIFDIRSSLKLHSQWDKAARQISCLSLSDLLGSSIIIGYWGLRADDASIEIRDFRTQALLQSIPVNDDEPSLPRSILVSGISKINSSNPTMFVSMADGHVVTFEVDSKTFAAKPQKKTLLGTREAELRELTYPDGHTHSVFVASEHPSLIYDADGRITFSAVDSDQIGSVCSFNTDAFPDAIVFATLKEIKIGRIDYERTTHVQPLQIGQTPRRLAYSRALKSFGIGTVSRTIEEGAEISSSCFQLVDEVMFKELDSYELNQDELIEAVIRAELDDGYGQMVERFLVGTSFVDDANIGEFRGRILVFEITEDRTIRVITQHNTRGACRCLGIMDGRIVAAMNKTVAIFNYEFSAGRTPSLNKVATYRTSTMPMAMHISGSEIAVADLMKSVSILQYKPAKSSRLGKDSLIEVARHYQTLWGTAVTKVDHHSWLESDGEGNLVVLSQNIEGATADDRRRLQVDAEFCLGELVNKMSGIDVEASPNAPVIPKALLATVSTKIFAYVCLKQCMLTYICLFRERELCICLDSSPATRETCL